MDVFDFITQEEIDELPEDPQAAFTQFARIASRRLAAVIQAQDDQDRNSWQVIEDARYGFINVVTAAAKRYDIQPFSRYVVPELKSFEQANFRQYKADLDHLLTQLLLEPGRSRDTIVIETETRSRLRSHLLHLKEEIEKSSLPSDRKQKLIDKLEEFERELDKRRINISKAAGVILVVLGTPGSVWASGEVVRKLTHNIGEMVGQAQRVEEELRPQVQASPAVRTLTAPRPQAAEPNDRESFPADLNDEIPF